MHITLTPDVGDTPVKCMHKAQLVASTLGISVSFQFNDYNCRAYPGGDTLIMLKDDPRRNIRINYELNQFEEY